MRRWFTIPIGLCSLGLAATVLAGAALASAPRAAAAPATASVSGMAWNFGDYRALGGAEVHIVGDPSRSAIVDGDGRWRIDDVVVGSSVIVALVHPDQLPIQTATLVVPEGGLERVSFQSPTVALAGVLADIIDEPIRPDRCQIATTVTRRGYGLDRPGPDGTHGEPGATVTIDPEPVEGGHPIYFNLSAATTIWPDRALRTTTADGGVLFANVTPGTYVLRAHKDGSTIESATVRCTAGVLTNASPPYGLNVTAGGLDLDETVPFGPYVPPTTPPVPTTGPSSSAPTTVPGGGGARPTPPGSRSPGASRPAEPIGGRARFTG